VQPGAAAPFPLNFSLNGVWFRGTVVNTAGVPLRRVLLQLTQLSPGPGPSPDALAANPRRRPIHREASRSKTLLRRYLLAAQRPGYLNASYQNARGSVLTLQAGQKTSDIVIKTRPQGIVAGGVIDEENEPLPGATVNIRPYLLSKDQTVIPTGPLGEGKTDADGEAWLQPDTSCPSRRRQTQGFKVTSPPRRQQESRQECQNLIRVEKIILTSVPADNLAI
jgi:hypothetical protein